MWAKRISFEIVLVPQFFLCCYLFKYDYEKDCVDFCDWLFGRICFCCTGCSDGCFCGSDS